MMLFALAVSAYVACTNCNGVGSVFLPCQTCSGSGFVKERVKKTVFRSMSAKDVSAYVMKDVACRDCFRGAYNPSGKGTGKKRFPCPVCKGQKKVKKNSTTPLTTAARFDII